MINWMRYRWLYWLISFLVIGIGIFSLLRWGLTIGVDFTGGAILEYQLNQDVSVDEISGIFNKNKINTSLIQKEGQGKYLLRLPPISPSDKAKVQKALEELTQAKVEELRFENIGPSVGPDLIRKTVYALVIAAGAILLWVAYQFKSLKFGASAVLAMLHDSLVLIGSFSLLGHFFGAEIDFLFVTAALTILSFSVHDTIVVYDRIRESQKRFGRNLTDLANKATSETMVRSLNNSFTIIFMLIALLLMGGSTIKWFAAALLIGTVSGTYSSPFVAVSLLVTWDEVEKKLKRK